MDETLDPEITAISAVARALDAVKEDTDLLRRVLRWTVDRYGSNDIGVLLPSTGGRATTPKAAVERNDEGGPELTTKFSDVAELFDAARPKTDWQKALVVGYWLMKGESQGDFAGADVNSQLKHLGHGVTNITDALNKAMQQKPALVIQTAKSGASKQARKKYKITRAGMTSVDAMIASGPGEE